MSTPFPTAAVVVLAKKMTTIGDDGMKFGSQECLRTGLILSELKSLRDLKALVLRQFKALPEDTSPNIKLHHLKVVLSISVETIHATSFIGDLPHVVVPIAEPPAPVAQAYMKVFPIKQQTNHITHNYGRTGSDSNSRPTRDAEEILPALG